MKTQLWTLAILSGFIAHEASAYEAGLGIGRMSNCVQASDGESKVCAIGPTLSAHWGLNLWGQGYDIAENEKGSTAIGENLAANMSPATSQSSLNWVNVGSNIDNWETLAIVVVGSLVMVSVGYAIIYPFSSRADVGFIGRTGYQGNNDIDLYRNEAGVYFRGYLSQHFPLYIYGSGLFSHQKLTVFNQNSDHNVFIKRVGLGLMSPDTAGLYFQGTWERSSLLDPSVKDVIEDSTTNRFKKQTVEKILDASHFELGYTWYY